MSKYIDNEQLAIDAAARQVAFGIIEAEKELKIPLERVQFYTAYCKGLQEAYERMFPQMIASAKKSERPYLKAVHNLIMSNINACYDYHVGTYEVQYKDFVNDKKGTLVSCRAYFVRRVEIKTEVKY